MGATVETCINNPVLRYLTEALLFIGTDDDGNGLDVKYSICDFDKDSLNKLYAEFQQFIDKCEASVTAELGDSWNSLEDFYCGGCPDGCVERDFIYDRCRCGVGFWDSGRWDESVSQLLSCHAKEFSELYCYVGDDKKIYI